MARKKLDETQISEKLKELDGWKTKNVNLKKRFEFENFAESLKFVNQVGEIAELRDHHPDITFGWGYAEFSITTHDTGGLTENDFLLAKDIEKIKNKE
jgi:4a-hydroxytetrahydrobiopterin dehydratase